MGERKKPFLYVGEIQLLLSFFTNYIHTGRKYTHISKGPLSTDSTCVQGKHCAASHGVNMFYNIGVVDQKNANKCAYHKLGEIQSCVCGERFQP